MAHAILPNDVIRRFSDLLLTIEEAARCSHAHDKRVKLANMTTQLVCGLLEGVEGHFFEVSREGSDRVTIRLRGRAPLSVQVAECELTGRARMRLNREFRSRTDDAG